MSFLAWTAGVGLLLTLTALANGWIERLPITNFAVYLAVGIAIGPWGLGLLDIDVVRDAGWLQRVTEVALVLSLFLSGLTLRVPRASDAWHVARRLAFPAMLLGIGGTAAAVHALLPLDWPTALILGAMLAPTDPVLASTISVNDAADRDGLRVALSGEAGMNDGSAMPFLLLGLLLLHAPASPSLLGHWAIEHLLWGFAGGVGIGLAFGWGVGHISTRLTLRSPAMAPGSLLPFGLVALAYAVAESAGALGFIAAFAAGAGVRMVEVRVMRKHHRPEQGTGDDASEARGGRLPPAESLAPNPGAHGPAASTDDPVEAVGGLVGWMLTFGGVLEQLIAPLLVLVLGVALAHHWLWAGVGIALLLFAVIRPLTAWIGTVGAGLTWQRRLLLGWLGIRGIGTLNYLAYAITHGLSGPAAGVLAGVAVTVVVLSIVVHGFTAQPLMNWRSRALERAGVPAD